MCDVVFVRVMDHSSILNNIRDTRSCNLFSNMSLHRGVGKFVSIMSLLCWASLTKLPVSNMSVVHIVT